jgi:hypothetical protein
MDLITKIFKPFLCRKWGLSKQAGQFNNTNFPKVGKKQIPGLKKDQGSIKNFSFQPVMAYL